MPDMLLELIAYLQSNLLVYLPAIFIAKILGLVIPVIPGGLFTLTAIPVIGWLPAYLIDLSGSFVAANIAYSISARYGPSFVRKLFGQKVLDKLASIRLKPEREVESSFMLRLAGTGMLSDALTWGAPLLRLPRWKFILGYHLGHIVTTGPLFYLTGQAVSLNQATYLIPIALASITLLFVLKGRYFE
ncbi:MAG: VTT domain-containing protein [bacterium]|nr:VTT domain-containing protein [bacterium]